MHDARYELWVVGYGDLQYERKKLECVPSKDKDGRDNR